MANPYTTMRQNVEAALEGAAGLTALGVKFRKWDSEYEQRVDNPASDLHKWIRVETVNLADEPFWSNSIAQTTHRMQVVAALPAHAGLKQADIEELFHQIKLALRPLSRDQNLATAIPALERFSFTGGEVALEETSQPNRQGPAGNLLWSVVGTVEAVYQEAL